MIRIDYIREFVRLADELNFSRASEDMYITQSSLSRHVSILESELGVRLLDRNTRNVSLTNEGRELYGDFTKLLDDYDAALGHAKLLSSGYSGRVTISTPVYWLTGYVEPAILQFSLRYPEIKVDLDIRDPITAVENLCRGTADLALGFESDTARDEVVFKKVFDERLCVLMSASHPLSGRKSVSLGDFASDRFVMSEKDDPRGRLRSEISKRMARHGIDPSQMTISENSITAGLAIRRTNAVILMFASLGNLGRDSLVSVPLSDEDAVMPLYLLRRKDSNRTVEEFFDMAPTE